MFDVLEKITELRETNNWSVYMLAKKSHIPQSTMSTWYAKGVQPPVSEIEKICDAFGITLSEFFAEGVKSENKLARMRRMSGLSQEELADRAEVSVETICAYEQKKRDISKAQYQIVKRLANVLECRTEDIV